jgi:hypothetical protein
LAGEFSLVDRSAVAEDAVAALLRQGSPESEQLVLQCLVAAPATDPEHGKSVAAAAWQDRVMAAVRVRASARLRKRLAEAVIDGTVPVGRRQALLSLLCEPNPLNLEAQVLVYQSQSADAATRAALAKQFVAASAEAMQSLLRLPSRQATAAPPTPERCYQIGALLWGPPLTNFLDVQHRALKALADDPGAMTLAATIPNDAMRVNFRRTLGRHWSEGPQTLRGAGVPCTVLVEPGLLAVLKSLARENQHAKVDSAKAAAAKPSSAHGHGNGHAKCPRLRTGETPKAGPEGAWDKLTEELVADYCRRCYLAVLARTAYQTGHSASGQSAGVAAAMPLLPGSEVTAAHSIEWPGEHAGYLPQLADNAWRLDYKRIEGRSKTSRAVAYYHRQLKHCIEHPLCEGMWLDGLTEGGPQEGVHSIDVLITRAGAAAGPPADEEQELTIQILSVDLGTLRE